MRAWRLSIFILSIVMGSTMVHADSNESEILQAVTFYASFDEAVRGDFGGGELTPSTRLDHPTEKGQFVFEPGYRTNSLRIVPGKGIQGGALEGFDVLPQRGRMYFPAKGKLAYKPDGWSGAVSYWINTDPNTMLKTPYCDPIQITEKSAADGGIWVDFPDTKPRDMRLGVFRGLAEGETAVSESDPNAPLVRIANVGFRSGDWHHIVMTWENFDTGRNDAIASLYVDGKRIGQLTGREIAMKWNIDRTGIYVAVNYIGLLDELAVFSRGLTGEEIQSLHNKPNLLAALKSKP